MMVRVLGGSSIMFTVIVKLLALSLIVFQLACTRAVDATNEILIDASGFNNKLSVSGEEHPILTIFNAHVKGKVVVDERRCPAMSDDTYPVENCPAVLFGQAVDFGRQDFPSGESIVIQVVIATMDSTGNINFYFKGKEAVLESGANTLVFNTSEFNIVEGSSAQGNVVGYIPEHNNFAGRLVGGFKPDPNQPEFRIFSSVYAGGHFNIFMPAGVKMTFKVLDPNDSNSVRLVLFENQSLDEIIDSIPASSVSAMAVELPKRFRWWAGNSEAEFYPAEKFAIGFFSAEAGKLVARNDGNYLLNFDASPALFDSDLAGANSYYYCDDYSTINEPSDVLSSGVLKSGAPDCSQHLSIDPSAGVVTNSTAAIIKGSATPSGCSPVSGETFGVYQTSKLCYNLNLTHLGGDSYFTKGFFQELPSIPANDGFINASLTGSGDEIEITYGFLPGMGNIVSGAFTFLLNENQEGLVQDPINSGVNCTELAVGSKVTNIGHYDVKSYDPVAAISMVRADYSLRTTVKVPLIATLTSPMVAVCPYIKSNGKLFFSNNGLISKLSHLVGNGNPNPSLNYATKIQLQPIWGQGAFEDEVCVPFQLRTVDDNGDFAVFPDSGSFTLSPDFGNFYDGADCGNALSTFPANADDGIETFVYYKAGTSNTGSLSTPITISGNISGMTSDHSSGITVSAAADNPTDFVVRHDFSNSVVGFCKPMEVALINSSGALATSSIDQTFSLSLNAGDVDFYSDEYDCEAGSAPSTVFNVSGAYKDTLTIWVKANSTAPVDFDYSGLASSNVAIPTFTPTAPLPVAGVDIWLMGTSSSDEHFFTGLCLPMDVRFIDANGDNTVGDNSVIGLNIPPNITVFNDSTCSSPTSSVTAVTGVGEVSLYYRIDSIADFAITANPAWQSRGGVLNAADQSQSYMGFLDSYASVASAGCSILKVGITDASGNLLSDSPYFYSFSASSFWFNTSDITGDLIAGDTFHADSTCTSDISSGGAVSIANQAYVELGYNGSSTASYFLDPVISPAAPGFIIRTPTIGVSY
tara:strand:+ start:25293 stop:28400 length:3108 start_codon:yes stop_codon:yes gene_type:complete